MNAFELMQKVGGEKVNGELRVRVDGSWVVLANNDILTDEGRKLAEQHATPARKKKAATTAPKKPVEAKD